MDSLQKLGAAVSELTGIVQRTNLREYDLNNIFMQYRRSSSIEDHFKFQYSAYAEKGNLIWIEKMSYYCKTEDKILPDKRFLDHTCQKNHLILTLQCDILNCKINNPFNLRNFTNLRELKISPGKYLSHLNFIAALDNIATNCKSLYHLTFAQTFVKNMKFDEEKKMNIEVPSNIDVVAEISRVFRSMENLYELNFEVFFMLPDNISNLHKIYEARPFKAVRVVIDYFDIDNHDAKNIREFLRNTNIKTIILLNYDRYHDGFVEELMRYKYEKICEYGLEKYNLLSWGVANVYEKKE